MMYDVLLLVSKQVVLLESTTKFVSEFDHVHFGN